MLEQPLGLFILLLVFLIIALICIVAWLDRNFKQIKEYTLTLKRNIPDPQQENVEKLLILNSEVKECLKGLLIDLGADWVQLWQFHNGIHGLGTGRIPFLFLAITHEICKDNVDKTLTAFAQLPLSIYGEFITAMLSKDMLVYQEYLDKSFSNFSSVCPEGTKVAFFRSIRDKDNQVVGFISAMWKTDFVSIVDNKLRFINGCQRMAATLASADFKNEAI